MNAHPFLRRLDQAELARPYGFVRKVSSSVVESTGPAAPLGELCEIDAGTRTILAEVAAVGEGGVILVPLEDHDGVLPEAKVSARAVRERVPVGDAFAGRAVDALGRPIDNGGAIAADALVPLAGTALKPMERADPSRILPTGVRAIDGLLTLGVGQRVGVFAASGVGKTSLMEQLCAQIGCDRVVLCLVGERGREVESIWRKLAGRDDASRFTIVAATSDESAALRARAVRYALCLADHWRGRGEDVLLLVDSVTRLAMALREIGLASGAPPTVRAYTPNVFAELPRVVERCGAARSGGSVTAVMTVLSETDDVDDPIVELMKSLLDGHIVLSRSLAEQGHFPAIAVSRSVSRGAERLVETEQAAAARTVAALLAVYEESRVMVETGVYKAGTHAELDRAIALKADIAAFLRQPTGEPAAFDDTLQALRALASRGAAHA